MKREGFYEAVTADKVSLHPTYEAYSATVPKWLLDVLSFSSYSLLLSLFFSLFLFFSFFFYPSHGPSHRRRCRSHAMNDFTIALFKTVYTYRDKLLKETPVRGTIDVSKIFVSFSFDIFNS